MPKYSDTDFSKLLQDFFEVMGYDKERPVREILASKSSTPIMAAESLGQLFKRRAFELSFQEEGRVDRGIVGEYFGRTVFALEPYQFNEEKASFSFYREFKVWLEDENGKYLFEDSDAPKYEDEQAEMYLAGVFPSEAGEIKIAEISDISFKVESENFRFCPSDLMQKRFLQKWIEAKGDSADMVVILVGSEGRDNIQCYPPFANEARESGKKVEVLNIDKAFKISFYGDDGVSFLGAACGNQYPQTYQILKDFIARKSAQNPVIFANYLSPFGFEKFLDLIEPNLEKKFVPIQGYESYSHEVILGREFFSIIKSSDHSHTGPWHNFMHTMAHNNPDIPAELIGDGKRCIKVFGGNGSSITISDLEDNVVGSHIKTTDAHQLNPNIKTIV